METQELIKACVGIGYTTWPNLNGLWIALSVMAIFGGLALWIKWDK